MLEDELCRLKSLLLSATGGQGNAGLYPMTSFDVPDKEAEYRRICTRWEAAGFSQASEEALVRYFNYHLKGISALSDTLSGLSCDSRCEDLRQLLNNLTGHLLYYFGEYLNKQIQAPAAYRNFVRERLSGEISRVTANLEGWDIPAALRQVLLAYVRHVDRQGVLTYHDLCYFETFLKAFSGQSEIVPDPEERLHRLLAELNYNDLRYIGYVQKKIADRLDGMTTTERAGELKVLKLRYPTGALPPACYPGWPSIQEMLTGWLNEELQLCVQQAASVENGKAAEKMHFDLSVSHLAFIFKLFYQEKLFGTATLTSLFRMISGGVSTKRQLTVSPGSLSKEFYSVDQQTAARVRDLLQRMISRINRNFFPVLAAASAACHFFQGSW
ncbi:hypothetical protein DYU05_05765 [Mucilaginibacter terrenus]|uniref:Uncharacterized protein n=1 Tax=Mucilaginibacter terrenus TaxID=2482727 RepID=A0A3E2NVR8_9SPHI|nr:hypothetical protein [Mucilaginibacter terrenus]RFZ85108.1 hypothetical protein DYU05_05765 [Mucilaginibacter terrenus]